MLVMVMSFRLMLKPGTLRGFVGRYCPRGQAARSQVAAGTAKRRGAAQALLALGAEASDLEWDARAGKRPTDSKPQVAGCRSRKEHQ
jgi:hypothetical protein